MKIDFAPLLLLCLLFVLLLSSFTVSGTPCNSTCGFGVCNNDTGICNCLTNWFGESCDEFICDKANPCLANGVCERVGDTDFKCNCPEGYGGTLCQANEGHQPVVLCSLNPSLACDHGVCVIDPVSQNETCVCEPGFSGETCTHESNPCLSRSCGVGTCHLKSDWFVCDCPEGWSDEDSCQRPINDVCFSNPCGNGSCTVPVPHNGKDYTCSCNKGYTGQNCSTLISFCDDDPCLNGGTCNELSDFSGYSCTCPPYYEGENCSTPYNPCSNCNTCSNNGTCYSQYSTVSDGVYQYSTDCNCTNGFTGAECEIDVDECLGSPCSNGGICINTYGGFICQCPSGITGHTCEHDINECDDDPCLNEGVCRNVLGSFICNCSSTQFTGPLCDIPLNQTCHANPCQFNGTCEYSDLLMKPVCSCPYGFTGDYCSYVFQPCAMGSCDPEGTLECITNNNSSSTSVTCRCRDGYLGPTCSRNIKDSCTYNQCLNNGSCTDINGTFFCTCLPGFSGRSCENVIQTECQSELTCSGSNGQCIRILEDEFCKCNDGWGGHMCEYDIDECSQTPCQNGGSCINQDGGYECSCLPNYQGINCELFVSQCTVDTCENGGTCLFSSNGTTCVCPAGYNGVRCETKECPDHCTSLVNSSTCDIECFNAGCSYDVKDPCFVENGIADPWAECPTRGCRDKYNNGYCDQECNNAICLYDGADCNSPTLKCPTERVEECTSLVDNGRCDESCNTYECPLDYNDCKNNLYLPNYLILFVKAPESDPFEGEKEDQFLAGLNALINAQVELIEKTEVEEGDIEGNLQYVNTVGDGSKYKYWKLVLKVNVAFCTASCPTTIEQVLRQIYAAYSNGQTSINDYGIVDAIKGSEVSSDDSSIDMGQIVGGIVGSLAVVVLVVVVIFVLGKRVRSDGGVRESVKKLVRVRGTFRIPGGSTPEPSEANLMTRGQSCSSDRHSGSLDAFDDPSPTSTRKGNHPLPHFTWNQLDAPVKTTPSEDSATPSPKEGATCVIGQRGKDQRKWTYLHCEAARMSNDGRDLMSSSLRDINSQGPGGLTPLMVAIMSEDKYYRSRTGRPGGSIRSDSSSGSEYSEYDPMIVSQSPKFPRMFTTIPHSKPYDSKIPTLIHAPLHNINLANDQGETALHLAVKHKRDEYIHYLLLIKADPNAQDRWGKTPLHVAIGAVNDTAAQILIECPRSNLELKSHGGITPLMLAVKMGNNRVLQQLLAKNAEITATDVEGRTAVHWSAMINNVEALRLLIKQGPDNVKDAPNLKGETALFLACREGCLGAVRHLLDCYANATLVDSLERSPLQIAYEKQNFDVMEMLQQSNQGPLGGPSPPLYPMKPLQTNMAAPMFGRNIKIEPPQIPPVAVHSQAPPTSGSSPLATSYHGVVHEQGSAGMTRYSSIEAELERLVASTQYPIMVNYPMYTPDTTTPATLPITHTSPSTIDSGHSPAHTSIISPPGVGSVGAASRSPGDSTTSTDPTFSPVGSEVYPGTSHTSPQAGITPPYSNPTIPPSSAASSQQATITGSTPLQHLPTTFMKNNGSASVHPTTSSEMQQVATSIESAAFSTTGSPLLGQTTVSPNPQATTMNGGYTSLHTSMATGSSSPSSHYGFPSPPKEAGDYGAYGTPYSGETINSVSSMTPSPEDGSSHQVDSSPQQYTTIHGQYSYSSDAYQISLQPCNTAIRGSHFSDLSSYNPKESTV